MRRIIVITMTLIFLLASGPALAVNSSIGTEKNKKITKDRSLTEKKTVEKKKTEGLKTTRTKSTGIDRSASEIIKDVLNRTSSRGMDITVDMGAIFISLISEVEETGAQPFSRCRICAAPRLPRNFGLSAIMAPNIVDNIKAGYLSSAAASNGLVRDAGGDEIAIREYKNCLAYYGAIIGQACLILDADVRKVAQIQKEKETTVIRGIGYDDLVDLAAEALNKARKKISNRTIRRLYNSCLRDKTPCQLNGSTEKILCGASMVVLSPNPQLTISGIPFYGGGRYAGFAGSYKINAGWSWNETFEKLKSSGKYAKFAKEVSDYSDDLKAKGKTTDAVLARKKAFDLIKSGKQSVSVMKLMPGL